MDGISKRYICDWGARAITNIILRDKTFDFTAALESIQKRPWLMDDLEKWLERLQGKNHHRCAGIFVGNSGGGVILGVLPFACELLKRGT